MIIIGKPSFDLSEKSVRRAGLDYWKDLKLVQYRDWDSFEGSSEIQHERVYLVTKFGDTCYTQEKYREGDCFVFGRETSGLPEMIRSSVPKARQLFIPMPGKVRSLNLSNAVAVVAYEAYRQLSTP